MATQQPQGQPPAGPWPPAVLEQYLRLKQNQDNALADFERRVVHARVQLLERHANEHYIFWTGQLAKNANSFGSALHGQVAASSQRQSAQQIAVPTPDALTRGDTNEIACEELTASHPNAPLLQATSTTNANSDRAPASQERGYPEPQKHQVIDLSSDEELESQQLPTTQTASTAGASRQQGTSVPPHPSGTLSFFRNNPKGCQLQIKHDKYQDNLPFSTSSLTSVPTRTPTNDAHLPIDSLPLGLRSTKDGSDNSGVRPVTATPGFVQRTEPMFTNRQTHPSQREIRVQLNNASKALGEKALVPTDRVLHQQQKHRAFMNSTPQHGEFHDWTPGLDVTVETEHEDVGVWGKTAEVEHPSVGSPRGLVRSQVQTRTNRIALPTPPLSQVSPTRKRKVQHIVSDDSGAGSDFEPSTDDDIPLILRRPKLVVKGTKATNSSGSAKPVSSVPKFGFKPMKRPIKSHFTASRPSIKRPTAKNSTTLAQSAKNATALSTLGLASKSNNAERVPGFESPSFQVDFRSPSRRAKQQALVAIDEHLQYVSEFRNEEKIRAADERERHLKATSSLIERDVEASLHRMSITPVPDSVRPGLHRVEARDAGHDIDQVTQNKAEGSVEDLAQWTRDRMYGDRHLSKNQASLLGGRGDEESEGELNTSTFQ